MRARYRLLSAIKGEWFDQFVGKENWDLLSNYFPERKRVDPPELSPQAWRDCLAEFKPDALLTGWSTPPIPAEVVPPLKLVAHTGGSVRRLLSEEMIRRGLLVTNWGSAVAPSVAECALFLILCTLRRANAFFLALQTDRRWKPEHPISTASLHGRRVGIHGFGNVAKELVQLLKPFGCAISAYSAGVPNDIFLQYDVEAAPSLSSLFSNSEVLVEVEALTADTYHAVGERLLRELPADASFVNVGRGSVVDEAALIRVAVEGRIHVGLDVYEEEPLPPDYCLRGLPNVTLLPHVAGPTTDARRSCGQRAVDNLRRFACGESLSDLVTPAVFVRST